jgi:dihydropteroate synthase
VTRPKVMGIVNVTPDSFSDGGRFSSHSEAVAHGLRLIGEGADILDIGGESTRPGAAPVSEADELSRVLPVIEGLAGRGALISIDTMKPGVARAAVSVGAAIWNDVNALRAPGAVETAAELNCGVVLMHMLGEPRTMQDRPHYDDVFGEVAGFLVGRAQACVDAGVARDSIWLDPGIGFGKTLAHNVALLKALPDLAALGYPVVLGASRKSFLKAIDPKAANPADRFGGSVELSILGAELGVACVRVHDVHDTVQALKVWEAVR